MGFYGVFNLSLSCVSYVITLIRRRNLTISDFSNQAESVLC